MADLTDGDPTAAGDGGGRRPGYDGGRGLTGPGHSSNVCGRRRDRTSHLDRASIKVSA